MQTISTTEKGKQLEDQLYNYLRDQIDRNELVYGIYPANQCKVFKNRKYHCNERQNDIDFDVVIEVFRQGRSEPHLLVIFECKNHKSPIQERAITDFSDKLSRLSRHGAKGVLVTSSRLQTGAENIARIRKLGIVKFDANGMDIVADRKVGSWAEPAFLKSQIVNSTNRVKPLRFAAYAEGRFFGSIFEFLEGLEDSSADKSDKLLKSDGTKVPFLSIEKIRSIAQDKLSVIGHLEAAVAVDRLCHLLGIKLNFTDRVVLDPDGNEILGSANFLIKLIEINAHGNSHRRRFTLAHEIGHFCLGHGRYLNSDSIVESDLFGEGNLEEAPNLERIEFQANLFASEFLLPYGDFVLSVETFRQHLEMKDRGHGYIFVDDQPCNLATFNAFLLSLSEKYDVSHRAIEVRLKQLNMVTDARSRMWQSPPPLTPRVFSSNRT
jgi:Zn-dependent peptidase ImmA (M78 family)